MNYHIACISIAFNELHILSNFFECSSANAKKWEVELSTLKSNNTRLTAALQESTANGMLYHEKGLFQLNFVRTRKMHGMLHYFTLICSCSGGVETPTAGVQGGKSAIETGHVGSRSSERYVPTFK